MPPSHPLVVALRQCDSHGVALLCDPAPFVCCSTGNAAAYTLNILNGPEVAPDQLNLGTDVISTPDNYKNYNGDTGLISNNATAAGSRACMAGEGQGIVTVSMLCSAAALLLSLALL